MKAHLRQLRESVRLLPALARELPRALPREMERRAKASHDFWAAHEPAVWAMAVTVAVLWAIALAVVLLT